MTIKVRVGAIALALAAAAVMSAALAGQAQAAPTIAPATQVVAEGDSGNTTVTFTIYSSPEDPSAHAPAGTNPRYRIEGGVTPGTATSGVDYIGSVIGEQCFDPCQFTTDVYVRGDEDDEPDETLFVNVTERACTMSGACNTTGTATAQLTIADDDTTIPPTATANCMGQELKRTDGTEGPDNITGTDLPDAIFGLGGDDLIKGIVGADCLDGGPGADNLKGGGGKDLAKGATGNDKLRGQGGKDKLKGQGGKDNIVGGEGNDRISGGGGKDKLRGGPAKDQVKGGGGADKINVVDNKRDKVNCGGGEDKATVDELDKVKGNCETVREVEAQ